MKTKKIAKQWDTLYAKQQKLFKKIDNIKHYFLPFCQKLIYFENKKDFMNYIKHERIIDKMTPNDYRHTTFKVDYAISKFPCLIISDCSQGNGISFRQIDRSEVREFLANC